MPSPNDQALNSQNVEAPVELHRLPGFEQRYAAKMYRRWTKLLENQHISDHDLHQQALRGTYGNTGGLWMAIATPFLIIGCCFWSLGNTTWENATAAALIAIAAGFLIMTLTRWAQGRTYWPDPIKLR